MKIVGAPSLWLSSSLALALLLLLNGVNAATKTIRVGDAMPKDLTLHYGFPPQTVNLDGRLRDKNVLLIGLPGAFTPT
jgi:hypothetical protein